MHLLSQSLYMFHQIRQLFCCLFMEIINFLLELFDFIIFLLFKRMNFNDFGDMIFVNYWLFLFGSFRLFYDLLFVCRGGYCAFIASIV